MITISAICLFTFASCSKADRCSELACIDDCVFVEIDRLATVHFYGCYDVWGVIFTNDEGEQIIGLASDMNAEYQIKDTEITFSATFYENDLPLILPDPMPGSFYRMEVCGMSSNSN
ncbi:MAG: hypothetical protein ACI86M_000208 [Saprospiraceae bacterium]|jgi:hypothetical protein